jgi:hypothetical protein
MIFDSDEDFGRIVSVDIDPCETDVDQFDECFESNCDGHFRSVIGDQNLPSKCLTADQLSHLTEDQRQELCDLLDAYQECFSDKPGFCSYFEHHIEISKDFKPKRLREYRIPELMKPEVQVKSMS